MQEWVGGGGGGRTGAMQRGKEEGGVVGSVCVAEGRWVR